MLVPLAIFVGGMFIAVNVLGWRVVRMYLRSEPPDSDLRDSGGQSGSPARKVAVVLALRGADPFLERCLRGLLDQDFGTFHLRIVVDNSDDPSSAIVKKVLAERLPGGPTVEVHELRRPRSTCSLKISAQVESLRDLRKKFDVIAFIDADAEPPRDWLRMLVRPFDDASVSATTGFRWYAPPSPTWGNLVRHLWNAASQPYMVGFGMPWGGTLALRASVFDDAWNRRHFRRCLCDDSAVANLVHRCEGHIRFLPRLTMVNAETTSLDKCVPFIVRQLLCPFVDLSNRHGLIAFNLAVAAALLIGLGGLAVGLWLGDHTMAGVFGGLLAFYFGGQMLGLRVVEAKIRQTCSERGQTLPAPTAHWRCWIAPVLTQVVHFYCLLRALLAKTVQWRGVVYRLGGHQRVRLERYRPFQETPLPSRATSIL